MNLYKDREAEIGTLLFNKDDEITIDFVTAAANIRAHNFSISMEVRFRIYKLLLEQVQDQRNGWKNYSCNFKFECASGSFASYRIHQDS